MSIFKGNSEIKNLYIGNQQINFVYKGSVLVYGKKTFEQIFTANGSITFPEKLLSVYVACIGAGGGGSGSYVYTRGPYFQAAAQGGGGSFSAKTYQGSNLENLKGKTVSFTVGVGGSGGAAGADYSAGGKGGDGGASIFQEITAGGGFGPNGAANYYGPPGGSGGTASGGDTNINGITGASASESNKENGQAINGVQYGRGGYANIVSGNPYFRAGQAGQNGCVYIRYDYL